MDTDRQYVRRREGLSWHVVRTHTRMFDGWRTLCGRSVVMDDQAALDSLPGAKSCETCLRIYIKGVDPEPVTEPEPAEDDGSTANEVADA